MAILDDAKQLFPDVSEQDLIDDLTGLKQQMPAAGDPELLKTLDTEYKKLKPQLYQQAMKPSVSEQDVSSLYDEAINRAREQVGNRTIRGLGQAIAASARGESVQPTYEKELAQAKQEQLGRSDAILKARQAEPSDAARRIGIIEGVEQKQAVLDQQKRDQDPTTEKSRFMQNLIKPYLKNVDQQKLESTPSSVLEKMFPPVVRAWEAEQNRIAKQAEAVTKAGEKDRTKQGKAKSAILSQLDKFNADNKDFKARLDEVGNMQSLLDEGKYASAFETARKMLIIISGDKRPSDLDMKQMSPNPSVFNTLKRIVDRKIGNKPLPEDINELKVVSSILARKGKEKLAEKAINFSKARAKYLEDTTEEELRDTLLTELGLAQPMQSGQSVNMDSPAKTVVKKGYNAKTNKTQFIYSDGTKEIVDGQR